ncbi:MAG: endonuclease/exonuclease/phosphatase family protein [Pirellulales bacterium]
MFPTRLTIVTYNLWNTERWPERQPALEQFVTLFRPDVLCLQELRAVTQACLDRALPDHQRVHDDQTGWTCEGNIYWNAILLAEVEHGAEPIGILEERRRMFWVRLRLLDSGRTVFVSNTHMTYQGHKDEVATGMSPRRDQANRALAALERLVDENEPVFFVGDLNDPYLVPMLMHEAGFQSCFSALGVQCPPTWPAYPTANFSAGDWVTNQTIDWILANEHARALAANVPQCFVNDISPSDHWPVQAVYEVPPKA